jgi:hypothetical protein
MGDDRVWDAAAAACAAVFVGDLDAVNIWGERQLYTAVRQRRLATIAALAARGANPNTPTRSGDLPVVAATGSAACLRALLNSFGGAVDVNAREADGRTALHAALEEGDAECMRLLLAAGADPDASRSACSGSRTPDFNLHGADQQEKAALFRRVVSATPTDRQPSPFTHGAPYTHVHTRTSQRLT